MAHWHIVAVDLRCNYIHALDRDVKVVCSPRESDESLTVSTALPVRAEVAQDVVIVEVTRDELSERLQRGTLSDDPKPVTDY